MQMSNAEILEKIASLEGRDDLLFSTPDNPYESIDIYAKVRHGCLTITDSERDHGPDGGWSHGTLAFDEENTVKAIALLCESNSDPFQALQDMLDYSKRTRTFRDACTERGIQFEMTLAF